MLHLCPRTQHMAHLVIHSLPEILAAFLHPPFHQRWAKRVLFCASQLMLGSGLRWLGEGGKCESRQVAAGLISGQVKKTSQRRKLVGVIPVMRLGTEAALKASRPRNGLLWTAEYCLY